MPQDLGTAFRELLEAAESVLANACDSGTYGPDYVDPDAEYPTDEDGDVWYHDFWDLRQAIEGCHKLISKAESAPCRGS